MQLSDYKNNRVLIVDDQEDIHADFVDMLKPNLEKWSTDDLADIFMEQKDKPFLPEFELLHATSGEEACQIVQDTREQGRPIAIAFVDIRMPPGIDGVETIRRIRKIDRDIELVIMTAYTDKSLSEIVEDMELLHKLLYIRKPFAREEIQQITLSLTGKWNVEQALNENREQLTASYQRLEAVLNATGDAMAMYDVDGYLVFANQGYEDLFKKKEKELKQIPPDAIMAQFKERFQDPSLSPMEGQFFIEDRDGTMREAISDKLPEHRLFYQSTALVHDDASEIIGRLMVYRDVSKEIEVEQMKAEVLRLRSELEMTYSFEGIIGSSPKMQQMYALMKQAAESDITVLLRGESGTGKELVAKSFHFNSQRKEGPFLAVNCAALPEGLIESELFGHKKGAFTGATQQRIGAFEHAQGGTLLLDEIGAMPPALQAKLLRVLQEREIARIGGSAVIPIDVRVIAATNQNLEDAIQVGAFRKDLFYRLSAFPIVIPPLRERREDIPLLINHFLKKCAERTDKPISGTSTAALRVLIQYDWPGNVRELENAIERAVLLETTDVLQVQNLPPEISPITAARSDQLDPTAVLSLVEAERQAIVRALEVSENNISEASRILAINRATLYRKIKKYELPAK